MNLQVGLEIFLKTDFPYRVSLNSVVSKSMVTNHFQPQNIWFCSEISTTTFEMCKSNGFSIFDWKQTKNDSMRCKISNRFRIIGFLFQPVFAIVYNWYFQFENDIHWIEFWCSVVHYFQD